MHSNETKAKESLPPNETKIKNVLGNYPSKFYRTSLVK